MYNGPERRKNQVCIFHHQVEAAFKKLCKSIENVRTIKLDKWIFILYITSVTALIIIAVSGFSWLAVQTMQNKEHILVLTVNQERLLKYFDIDYVKEPATAEKIIKEERDEKDN